MGNAIKHCLANLTNFEGRDARATFWWWVLAVVIVNVLVSFISGIVFAASSMAGAISGASSGADPDQLQVQIMQSMAGSLGTQAWIGVVVSLASMALIAATFVRRLRDAGLPPLLMIIPVVTTLASAYFSISLVGEMTDVMATGDLAAIEEASASSALWGTIGWIGYLVILVGGLLPSKGG